MKHHTEPLPRAASRGRILSGLTRLSDRLKRAFHRSFAGYLLAGNYRSTGDGLFTRLGQRIAFRRRVSIPLKRAVSRACDRSLIRRRVESAVGTLPDLPLRLVGVFTLSLGLTQGIIYTVRRFYFNLSDRGPAVFYLSVAAALVGGLLMFSSRKLGDELTRSRVFSFLLFRVLGMREESLVTHPGATVGQGSVSFFFGVALGAAGSLTSPVFSLTFCPLIGLLYLILVRPESGVVLLFFTFPLLGIREAAPLIGFIAVSWVVKLLRGKRTVSMMSPDIAVISAAAVLFFGGLVSVARAESLLEVGRQLVLLLTFFLTVNLIRTTEWIRRCFGALLFGLGLTAAIGLTGLLPESGARSFFTAAIPSSLAEPSVLIGLLVLLVPIASAGRDRVPQSDTRLVCRLLSLSAIAGLLFFGTTGDLAAAAGALLFAALLGIRTAWEDLIALTVVFPLLLSFLPGSLAGRLLPTAAPAAAFDNGELLSQALAGGIGPGEAALKKVLPLFQLPTAYRPSLYARLLIAFGAAGVLVFVMLVAVVIRHGLSYHALSSDDDPILRRTVSAGLAGFAGFLIRGLFACPTGSYPVMLLLWLILGFTSAAVRTGTRERITRSPEGPYLEIPFSALSRRG